MSPPEAGPSNQPFTPSRRTRRSRSGSPPRRSTGKRKERDGSPPSERQSKKTKKGKAKDTTRTSKQKKTARRKNAHHIRLDALDESEASLQKAFNVHLQAMWGITSSVDIPATPSAAQVAAFKARFGSTDSWEDFRKSLSYDHNQALASINTLRSAIGPNRNPIARNVAGIDDQYLHIIFSAILSAGFPEWRPDVVTGTPESLYNRAHQTIAIHTFQVVATAQGYMHMSPDLSRLQDPILLGRLYNNFVWALMRDKILQERARPGAVVARRKVGTVYKRRGTLKTSRVTTIARAGWPKVVVKLAAETFCHSDDEIDPVDGKYWTRKKTVRGANPNDFFATIDEDAKVLAAADGKPPGSREVRTRKPAPANVAPSALTNRLPRKVPLDFFDHVAFNKFPVQLRACYRNAPIALPARRHWVDGKVPDSFKTMTEANFMAGYGDEVRKQYDLPTEAEAAQMEDWEWMDDDDVEGDDDIEPNEDDEDPGEPMEEDDV
ncbi:hypothetical protein C8R43DRAFT_948477 [Mycena crocata]|nr:hypothetical protein C8R43DRAFT_948477 [Mycena crocata]